MTPAERGEALRELVEKLKGKPCVYGEDDCSMIAIQWVADQTGKEIDWPLYNSQEEAERIIEEAGGLVNIWTDVARKTGLEEWDGTNIDVGDVGVIHIDLGPTKEQLNNLTQVGGIFLFGGTFLWRAENGVRVIGLRRHTIVKVWKV